jgi:predicted amidohydrolase/NH3-dependent NAD+ synthetase
MRIIFAILFSFLFLITKQTNCNESLGKINIALCQINAKVGDIPYNLEKIKEYFNKAKEAKADVVVFPESALAGYPLNDLAVDNGFLKLLKTGIQELIKITRDSDVSMIVGTPWHDKGSVYNAALFIKKGEIVKVIKKIALPNYGVFDEKRIFKSGETQSPLQLNGLNVGVIICEDMWVRAPMESLKEQNADFILSINGSPFEFGKNTQRELVARERIKDTGLPLIYLNLIGGQDSLVFDGNSFIIDEFGNKTYIAPAFKESLTYVTVVKDSTGTSVKEHQKFEYTDDYASIYQALVLSVKDYVVKNNLENVVIKYSDSSDCYLTTMIAIDALGPQHVHFVCFTPQEEDLNNIKKYFEISNKNIHVFDLKHIEEFLKIREEEKLSISKEESYMFMQNTILAFLSKKFNWITLVDFNKTDISLGAFSLYNTDGLNIYSPLKDVYKSMAYNLCHWRNNNCLPDFLGGKKTFVSDDKMQTENHKLIPLSYAVLDKILELLIEQGKSFEFIYNTVGEKKIEGKEIKQIFELVHASEGRRKLFPLGPKVSKRDLTSDRRYPVANGYRGD